MTIRILHLEDDALDGELIGDVLEASIPDLELRRVAARDEYVKGILERPPHVILADYRVPGFDGLAALAVAREIAPAVPFIFVSGTLGEETAVDTLRQGAADYIVKGRLTRLVAAVRGALRAAENRAERLRAEGALMAQKQLLRALIDSIPDMIYAVDYELRLTVANRAMLDFIGATEEQAIGSPLRDFLQLEEVRPGVAEDSLLMATAHAVVGRESHRVIATGERRWFLTTKTLITAPDDGRVVGLVSVSRDVTARKRMEREMVDVSNREQRRIGADIHDGLGQELTGLSLMLKGLESRLDAAQASDARDAIRQVSRIRELSQRAIGTARALARGLAPVELERDGLAAALRNLVHRSAESLATDCRIDCGIPGRLELDDDVAMHLYRIAQESIANAAKHGHAKQIVVSLWTDAERVHLEIRDDGEGIGDAAASAAEGGGMGLSLMRYRATSIGGELHIGPNSPRGTLVRCWCPLRADRREPRTAAR